MLNETEQVTKWKEQEKNFWENEHYKVEEKTNRIVAMIEDESYIVLWDSSLFNALKKAFLDCDQLHAYYTNIRESESHYVDFVKEGLYYRFIVTVIDNEMEINAFWYESIEKYITSENERSFTDIDQMKRPNLLAKYNVFRQAIMEHSRYRLKLLSGCMEVDDTDSPFNTMKA